MQNANPNAIAAIAAAMGAPAATLAEAPAAVVAEAPALPPTAPVAKQPSQWVRELARAQATLFDNVDGKSKAAYRFVKLAAWLMAEAQPGQTVRRTAAQANKGADLNRGRTGDMAASWRLALQRTRQLFGGDLGGIVAKVETEGGQVYIAITAPAEKAEATPAA